MTENESLLEYCERAVKNCVEECGGACSLRIKECECLDANVLKHLKELQQYRSIGTVEECKEAVLNIWHFYMLGRNKAIDEFAERLKDSLLHNYRHLLTVDTDGFEWLTTDAVGTHIEEIAEQMKGGE